MSALFIILRNFYFLTFFRVHQFSGLCCVAKTPKQVTTSWAFDALHLPNT